jgi:hypothetical protein
MHIRGRLTPSADTRCHDGTTAAVFPLAPGNASFCVEIEVKSNRVSSSLTVTYDEAGGSEKGRAGWTRTDVTVPGSVAVATFSDEDGQRWYYSTLLLKLPSQHHRHSLRVHNEGLYSEETFQITHIFDPENTNAVDSAQFSLSAGTISLTLKDDFPSNKAGYASRFLCSELLEATAESDSAPSPLLGRAWCKWRSATALTIEPSSSANIAPRDAIAIKRKRLAYAPCIPGLGSQCWSTNVTSVFFGGSTSLLPPSFALIPGAVVTGPTTIGACDSLLLDGSTSSGSGGRTLVYEWSLLEALTSTSEVANVTKITVVLTRLNEASSSSSSANKLYLQANQMLPNVVYTFRMRVTNFFYEADEVAVTVKKEGLSLPVVDILGVSELHGTRGDHFRLRATITAPTECTGSDSKTKSRRMDVQWRITGGSELARAAVTDHNVRRNDVRTWLVPGSMLDVKQNYTVCVSATLKDDPSATNTDCVAIKVLSLDVFASVSGGTRRQVGAGEVVALSAKCSYDPDHVPGGMSPCAGPGAHGSASEVRGGVTFEWQCRQEDPMDSSALFPCFAPLGTQIELPKRSTNSSLLFHLRAPNDGEPSLVYQLVLVVCAASEHGGCLRNSTSSTVVEIAAVKTPAVGVTTCEIEANVLNCDAPVRAKVSPNERLVLNAKALAATTDGSFDPGDFLYTWTERVESLHQFRNYFATSLSSASLVIKAGMLGPRSSYTFRITATDRSTGATGFAEVAVTVNAPPTSGSVGVRSCDMGTATCLRDCCGGAEGYGLETHFDMAAVYWVDDTEDLPLEFEFNFVVGQWHKGDAERPLGHRSLASSLRSQLPQGNLTIVARVYDNMGAGAVDTATAVVRRRPDIDVTEEFKRVVRGLTQDFEEEDGEKIVRTVGFLVELLNEGVIPPAPASAAGSGGSALPVPTNAPTSPEANVKIDLAKVKLREDMLELVSNSSALIEPTLRSILSYSMVIERLTVVPSELSKAAQHKSIELIEAVIGGSEAFGLMADTTQAVGRSLSSVIEAGIFDYSASDESSGVEATKSATESIYDSLSSLSKLELAAAVADQDSTSISTANIRMSSARKSKAGLSFSALVSPGYRGDNSGRTAFQLPPSLASEVGIKVDYITDTTVIEFPCSPFTNALTSALREPSSSVLSLTLHTIDMRAIQPNRTEVAVQGLARPIQLKLPLAPKVTLELQHQYTECNSSLTTECVVLPECYFYDKMARDWSSRGCVAVEVIAPFSHVVCNCSHLTSFMGKVEGSLVSVGEQISHTIASVKDLNLEDLRGNLSVVIMVGSLWVLYALGIMTVLCSGRSREKWLKYNFENEVKVQQRALKIRQEILSGKQGKHLRAQDSLRKACRSNTLMQERKKRHHGGCVYWWLDHCGLLYKQYEISYTKEMQQAHPVLACYYAPNTIEHITLLFLLILGEMVIDTMFWSSDLDAAAGLSFSTMTSDHTMFFGQVAFSLGVDLLLLPFVYLFTFQLRQCSSQRRRDALWRVLPFEKRTMWLFNTSSTRVAIRRAQKHLRSEKLKTESTPNVDMTEVQKLEGELAKLEEIEQDWAERERGVSEEDEALRKGRRWLGLVNKMLSCLLKLGCIISNVLPIPRSWLQGARLKFKYRIDKLLGLLSKKRADLRKHIKEKQAAAMDDYYKNVLRTACSGVCSPKDSKSKRKGRWLVQMFYLHFVEMGKASLPKVVGKAKLQFYITLGGTIFFCMFASFYVLVFGVCGPAEKVEGGSESGYQCGENWSGQSNEMVLHWVQTLVTIFFVTMLLTRPLSICFSRTILKSCMLAKLKGRLHFRTEDKTKAESTELGESFWGESPGRNLVPDREFSSSNSNPLVPDREFSTSNPSCDACRGHSIAAAFTQIHKLAVPPSSSDASGVQIQQVPTNTASSRESIARAFPEHFPNEVVGVSASTSEV